MEPRDAELIKGGTLAEGTEGLSRRGFMRAAGLSLIGAAAAGGPKVSKYFPTDEGVFNTNLMKYKILLQEKIAFFIEYQTPVLTICTHRSML